MVFLGGMYITASQRLHMEQRWEYFASDFIYFYWSMAWYWVLFLFVRLRADTLLDQRLLLAAKIYNHATIIFVEELHFTNHDVAVLIVQTLL